MAKKRSALTIHNIILSISLIWIVGGCSGSKNNPETTCQYETIVINDSAQENDSTGTEELEKRPKLHFNDLRSALEYIERAPDADKYNSGIIPLILKQDLVYGTKLLNNEYDRFIIVDKTEMKVFLYDRFGRLEKSYGMACAKKYGTKHKKADSRTPEGFFTVEGIYDSTDWLFTDDFGKTSKVKGQFGPRFIRLRCPNTSQIGIHGTGAPWSIGHRVSHGCIRITNENIMELVGLVTPGMPVIVNPSPRDANVNLQEGYHITLLKLMGRPDSYYEYKGLYSPEPKEKKTDVVDTVQVKEETVIETEATENISNIEGEQVSN